MTSAISTDAMLRDLGATFPQLWARPLADFAVLNFEESAALAGNGIRTGQDIAHLMPDGLPIFFAHADGDDAFEGGVHTGFLRWLARRGWCCERHDGDTYHLTPESARSREVQP